MVSGGQCRPPAYSLGNIMSVRLKLGLIAVTLTTLSSLAAAGPSYRYKVLVPGMPAMLGTSGAVSSPAPVAQSPVLVGDGTSTKGACTDLATGCATLAVNPLDYLVAPTLSGDGLTLTCAGDWATAVANISKSSGKWYWEARVSESVKNHAVIGVVAPSFAAGGHYPGQTPGGVGYYTYDGSLWYGTGWSPNVGPRVYVNDVIGVALDMDAHTITYTLNGAPLAFSGVTGSSEAPAVACYFASNPVTLNMGQANFAYPVPAGFNAGVW